LPGQFKSWLGEARADHAKRVNEQYRRGHGYWGANLNATGLTFLKMIGVAGAIEGTMGYDLTDQRRLSKGEARLRTVRDGAKVAAWLAPSAGSAWKHRATPFAIRPMGPGFRALGVGRNATVRTSQPIVRDSFRRATNFDPPNGFDLDYHKPHIFTQPDAAVQTGTTFWSGGTTARTAAETWATASGGTTLEMTSAGRNLMRVTQGMSWQQARPMWIAESRNFAANASGGIHVFQNAAGVSTNSIWATVEYPTLINNPSVTGIVGHVVMPDGTVIVVP
jgi:hypothetical protein